MPCDVIVAGAGPAGALAATILARAGVRVQLFDRARFPRPKLCGDTVNPGALRVLGSHVRLDPIVASALPLDGMVLTGPGVAIVGTYGQGLHGRAITRRVLDVLLVEEAVRAGARFADNTRIAAPVVGASGHVAGVVLQSRDGMRREHRAPLVIAADGRESRLARALGLTHHPVRPRRWAVGGYFDGVTGLGRRGEMHVRAGHYIGVAPVPNGLANACLVLRHRRGQGGWRDPEATLLAALRADARLAARFAPARLVEPPQVLGPMAVDARAAGLPGLLLAGDAAGFIDPITGDGLRFALEGATLAALVALDVLAGRCDPVQAPSALAERRRAAFAAKWRFNRAVRLAVASSGAIGAAAVAARALPRVFQSVIRYAGDCE
ncbi:MAG TPA: FAD-dependent monooxygenase [Vicinamibacterales bacterium]|nr:FAD-dependent monooxygenase [Vicinamibacterales bacterium]